MYFTKEHRQKLSEAMIGNKNSVGNCNRPMLGKRHSDTDSTKLKISESLKGEKHPNWKGDETKYPSIHTWLVTNFGSASVCERIGCEGRSNTFDYALMHGKKHGHYRDRYKQMCRSCHQRYDRWNLKVIFIK